MNGIESKLEQFRALVQADTRARYIAEYGMDSFVAVHEPHAVAVVKPGKKYAKVDVGRSGKYMVEMDTGRIFGIKAYGVIHRGHQYGDLDTIADYDWGGYVGVKRQGVAA